MLWFTQKNGHMILTLFHTTLSPAQKSPVSRFFQSNVARARLRAALQVLSTLLPYECCLFGRTVTKCINVVKEHAPGIDICPKGAR